MDERSAEPDVSHPARGNGGPRDPSSPVSWDRLRALVAAKLRCKVVCLSLLGPHAAGYAAQGSPLILKGIHVEPTERVVGLTRAPDAANWVGEFDGHPVDFTSSELGAALHMMLRGRASVLERILAPWQLHRDADQRALVQLARGALSRQCFTSFREPGRTLLREFEEPEARTLGLLLAAYRWGLTGVVLLSTGELELDLSRLAEAYGFGGLAPLLERHRRGESGPVEEDSPWINRLARVQALLERAHDESPFPPDPANAREAEEYLLDMRRRFFDATTMEVGR